MSDHLLPVLYVLFLWWFSTGFILYLDGLPRRTYRRSLLGATLALLASLAALAASRDAEGPLGAYLAFTAALLVWAWNELAFLLGFVTGWKHSSDEDYRGWRHFVRGALAIGHHELAIAASAAAVVWVTWGGSNQVGTWTFLILWAMRLSTKLNLFLGVPNLPVALLPPHLLHLERYFTRRPMNPLFPVSATLATVATVVVALAAGSADADAARVAGCSLLATLLALAVLEHWFLVLPLPAEALFGWGLRSRETPAADPGDVLPLRGRREPEATPVERGLAKRGRDR